MDITNREHYALLAESKFPTYLRGDILLTNNPHSWLAKIIRKATQEKGEAKSKVNHGLIYVMAGWGIEAGAFKIGLVPLRPYFVGNYTIYRVRRKGLTLDQRSRIIAEAFKMQGTPYDYLQLLGFLAYHYTGWKWTQKYLQLPGLEVCTTFIQEVYKRAGFPFDLEQRKKAEEIFGIHLGAKLAPDDIYDIAIANPELYEFKLVN